MRLRISEAYEFYIKDKILANGGSPKTKESYENTSKLLQKYFGDIYISRLDVEMVTNFKYYLMDEHAINTVRGHLSCLKQVCRYCKRKHIKVGVDADEIESPKKEKKIPNSLSEEDVGKFLGVISEKRRGYPPINRMRNRLLAEMLFDTGLRISELCSLNRDCLETGEVVIIGKGNKPRVCFISKDVVEKAQAYLKERQDDNPALFVAKQTGNRMTPDDARRVFRNACKRSSFENVHPHTMRHSCGRYMHAHNIDMRDIGEFLGHESLDTTKLYTKVDTSRLRRIHEDVMAEKVHE